MSFLPHKARPGHRRASSEGACDLAGLEVTSQRYRGMSSSSTPGLDLDPLVLARLEHLQRNLREAERLREERQAAQLAQQAVKEVPCCSEEYPLLGLAYYRPS